MSNKFGTTWWGKAWLKALKKIDYSNKIEKGRESAEKGFVESIQIQGNIIEALVNDEDRVTPYNITIEFPEFSEMEKEEIHDIIESNHYYISQLESKKLPPDLKDELDHEMINLCPYSLSDIKMKCNCVEESQPCQHVSAIFYLIAGEIDKNPFLIFTLRGFDIYQFVKDEEQADQEQDAIPAIDDFLTGSNKSTKLSKSKKVYNTNDLSVIPDELENIKKLLTGKPLFYKEGDFKKEFIKAYEKFGSRLRGFLKRKEKDTTEDTENIYNNIDIEIKNNSFDFNGQLTGDEETLNFNLENMDEFIEYLHYHSLGDITNYPPVLAFMAQIYSFTLMLMRKSAYIPEIFSIAQDEYMIRWIPAIYEEQVRRIYNDMVGKLPRDIIHFKGQQLYPAEQVNFLISFIISHFQRRFDICPKRDKTGILYLFFFFEVFTELDFEDRQTAQTIHLWLSQFYIKEKDYTIIVKIDESPRHGDRFYLQIMINKEDYTEPVHLKKYLSGSPPEKNFVLKDLSLLANYLPQINDFLQLDPGEKKLTIYSENFVDVWFDALPIIHTLGVKTILPEALKEVFKPSVSLDMQVIEEYEESAVSYVDLKSLLDFKWNIAVGDHFLNKEEFQKLVENYSGIVKHKDTYVYIDEKKSKQLLKKLDKKPKLSRNDILRIGLKEEYNDNDIKTDQKFNKLFKDLFTRRDPQIPEGLEGELRHYQERGYKWLYNNFKAGIGSLIADDMGLGKTVQVIALLQRLKEEDQLDSESVLVIVPATLITNWYHEINKFAPHLSINIYHGQDRKLGINSHEIIITTYSLARIDRKKLNRKNWQIIISDETQKIKNPSSRQTKAVKSLNAKNKIAMTGTPVENRLMDYWSIFDFIMENFLGPRSKFKYNFAIPIERYRDQKKLEEFRNITAPFILRRTKTDPNVIDDLPEKMELDEYTSLKQKQAALYQKIIDETRDKLTQARDIDRKGQIFKLLNSLKQVCNHPAQYLGEEEGNLEESGKSELLIELLDKIFDRHEKALIFTQYVQMGTLLVKMLKEKYGFKPLFLHGSLSRKKRDELIDNFQNEPRKKIFILSLRAGGVGLNLTTANHVIHYDLWWNPAVENQATDRAFRIGQEKDVTSYRLITEGTFEERINDILKRKKKLADMAVRSGEKWITELSDEELHDLIKLDRNN
jgi:SNF2 family DNA or RNA helicase